MGLAIDTDHFDDAEFEAYEQRLRDNLAALGQLLENPRFARGPVTLGAELELSLVDQEQRALPLNREVLDACRSEQAQPELDGFNLEYNFSPCAARGRPFANLQNQILLACESLDSFARGHDGRVVSIGILPTLRRRDLAPKAMTDLPRYRALAAGLRRLRGANFDIDINGAEGLQMSCESIVLEGANTSFQLHLRVDPADFAASFNAAQMMTPLALAVSANSPIFLESLLWDETRVALFKQATDTRGLDKTPWRRASRVPFGHGWVREGALELFAEAVALHPVILPVCDDEDPLECLANGDVPKLRELRLHQGTIWQWNRPIYDPAEGGHLRIELRALPSGPTAIDMTANAAFLLGLVIATRPGISELLPAIPFRYAEYNFYRAAQQGLDAQLLWPSPNGVSPLQRPVRELIDEYLPVAAAGLASVGVDASEIERLLGVIAARNASGVTGARWQRSVVQAANVRSDRRESLRRMLARYMDLQDEGGPVGAWPVTL